jgi:hypothetical protein
VAGAIAGDETILVICSDSTTAGAVRTNCSGFWNPDALDYGRFNFSGTGGLSFTRKQTLRPVSTGDSGPGPKQFQYPLRRNCRQWGL